MDLTRATITYMKEVEFGTRFRGGVSRSDREEERETQCTNQREKNEKMAR